MLCRIILLLAPTAAYRVPPLATHAPAASPSTARARPALLLSPEELEEVWWEDGLTCVEYLAPDGRLMLGVYVAYSVLEDEPHIRPLCASAADEGVSALLCDEDVPVVPLSAVQRVLDPDYVFVSERQAGGGQGLGNPHGEHGEECYDLRELELSDDVTLVVREGRDTERVL